MTRPLELTVPDRPALVILRDGLNRTAEFRRGLAWAAGFAVFAAVGRLAIPVLIQRAIDLGLVGDGGVDVVWQLIAVTGSIVGLVTVSALIARLRMIRAAEQALIDLRTEAFARVHALSTAELAVERRGELVAKVTSHVDAIARFLDRGALAWVTQGVLLLGIATVMTAYSWVLTLVVFGVLGLAWPVLRMLQKGQLAAYRAHRRRISNVLVQTERAVDGAQTVRLLGAEAQVEADLIEATDAEYDARLRTSRYLSGLLTVSDLLHALPILVMSVVALALSDTLGLELGELAAILLLIGLAHGPLVDLLEVLDQTQEALAAWDEVLVLLARPQASVEAQGTCTLPTTALAIDLDAVTVTYGNEAAIDNLTLHIAPGSNVAVVGATGAGKTTLARLVTRLVDPTHGTVRVGDVPLTEVAASERRRAIRLVPQDGFLFATSVAANIMAGRDDSAMSDVDAVVARLGLVDWVASLPDGLRTAVGPGGRWLSVGERQIVALARAAMTEPGILVLDEATSAIDPQTEQLLQTALERIGTDRTVVTIAHRLGLAARADEIIVLEHGRLLQRGEHRTLAAEHGPYCELYEKWRRGR